MYAAVSMNIYVRKIELTENGSVFSLVGKRKAVIDFCFFGKRALLCRCAYITYK